MSLYRSKLESKLDKALSKQTRESLTEWIGFKRNKPQTTKTMKTDKIIKIENRIVYLKEKIDRREIYGDNFKPHYFHQQLEVAVNNWLRETGCKFKKQKQ